MEDGPCDKEGILAEGVDVIINPECLGNNVQIKRDMTFVFGIPLVYF